ncbi:MAG: DNA adenine methylase [Planctomycetaceae bacterium]
MSIKKHQPDMNAVVNVASVPHRSLFRYPGGKTWLVPHVRSWLTSLPARPAEFGEPFAGGGIVGLSVIFEQLVEHLTLVELDADVGAVWHVILNGKGSELAKRIQTFKVSYEAVRSVLDNEPHTVLDRAFSTIVRNRMQHGGIMAPGASLMKAGENGKGLLSRWYPETLVRRILDIATVKKHIRFVHGNGVRFIQENSHRMDIVFFIDPPYTVAGRRLYAHSEIDHDELFNVASQIRGDFLMTYDNVTPVRNLAKKYGFDTEQVAMKNTHHTVMSELLIGRNLDWARR